MKTIFQINSRHFYIIFSIAIILSALMPMQAQQGAIWHVPSNSSDLYGTPMRELIRPTIGTSSVTIYQGLWKPAGGWNQTGGAVYWRKQGSGTWNQVPLSFHTQYTINPPSDVNQFWKASFPLSSIAVGEVVEYYIRADFDNTTSPRFLHGSNVGTTNESQAQANPTTFTLFPGFLVNNVNADYTTTKFFIDESKNESYPVTVQVDMGNSSVQAIEVFTNLNNRDRAALDANNDGIHDGIYPPDGNLITIANTNSYYQAYSMTPGSGGNYSLTLNASKTGAYRLTIRWKLTGDTQWRWYPLRDHAIVVSPKQALDIRMYELNVFNQEASGTTFATRSTWEDMWDGPGAIHTNPNRKNQFNLDYLTNLGVNWIWFQPIHPYGVDGRHLSAQDIMNRAPGTQASTWLWNGGSPSENVNYPYALGSPYAVKNFWEIEPRMSANYSGTDSIAIQRQKSMQSFQAFAAAAKQKGIKLMLDAAFNHTAHDAELGNLGSQFFGGTALQEIRNQEIRFFSRNGNYGRQAGTGPGEYPAPAPDRGDFGKWLDVKDVFFGVYDALVKINDAVGNRSYFASGDWFNYSGDAGADPGYFNSITQKVWQYFGSYMPYWSDKTNNAIGGLRCDFAQGLPPQAWEYIINRARAYDPNVVFMAETLDGGSGQGTPGYRSNRHFDILNENLLFALKNTNYNDPSRPEQAITSTDIRAMMENRRQAYGFGLVLLNTQSHDEDSFNSPWHALTNYAAAATHEGAPMIFPGQELGISKFFGYDLMEKNFGKFIPHFKTYNSMMPLWFDNDFGNDQLYPVYAGINRARMMSPALRAHNRYYIDQTNGNPHPQIFSVAKFEVPNGNPATTDVVFGFVNLGVNNSNNVNNNFPNSGTFNVNITQNGSNLFGINPAASYNVINLAAYTGPNNSKPERAYTFLWPSNRSGNGILNDGIFVALNAVPTTVAGWNTAPYEPQYLKLMDMNADNDGDGFTNEQERQAGTNPLDNNSYFAIESINILPNHQYQINWKSVVGKTYQVQFKDDLTAVTWQNLGAPITATGTTTSFTDTTVPMAQNHRFYRVVIN
jgi:glycosidase